MELPHTETSNTTKEQTQKMVGQGGKGQQTARNDETNQTPDLPSKSKQPYHEQETLDRTSIPPPHLITEASKRDSTREEQRNTDLAPPLDSMAETQAALKVPAETNREFNKRGTTDENKEQLRWP
ncbi:predicted protein [Arabidopsis lyrata subsp. lyrata]|uniref:Predicted protein n=1 Tax=Arabidopsis lyrata subsp. lyrata TaxID=81972 RepID=D7MVT7_ARALL|nr:predicted protein [Arabidopsis lyrata subsp. lyrata]